MQSCKWTDTEIDHLRSIYSHPLVSLAAIAEHFGRSERAIISKAYELHLKRRAVQLKKWTLAENEQLGKLYTNKRISTEQLKKTFGRSANAITKQARSLGISRYNHQINHTYFDDITSDEQAYWLGWLAADGSVKQSSLGGLYISLELSQRDEQIVQAFAQAVAPNAVLHRSRNAVSVRLGSMVMARDLANMVWCPTKRRASTGLKLCLKHMLCRLFSDTLMEIDAFIDRVA